MAYTKTDWQNLPNQTTPINSTNLNKIENELVNLDSQITTINSTLGTIIENGSNANARYVKFSDGTLIQYGYVSLTVADSRSSGGLTYWSQADDVTLPYNFLDTNYYVTTNVVLANMNYFCQSYGAANTKDEVRISFISTNASDNRTVHFICIGRWK